MNKDVVYIEPEEDITDIIAKVEGAKSKIVALVPPKKAGVFRSIVNIKLIAKSAAGAKKTVVLVTTDPSIIKLAAATEMPVTKDLNTAPAVPEADAEIDETEVVDVEEEAEEATPDESSDETSADSESDDSEDEDDTEDTDISNDEDETEVEEDEKPARSSKKEAKKSEKIAAEALDEPEEREEKKAPSGGSKSAKGAEKAKKGVFAKMTQSDNRFVAWIGAHPKVVVGSGVGLVVLIVFMVWAFAIAPAVTITLELETTTGNFSENVSFTETLKDEKASEGKFYIEQKKIESKAEVEFEATGKKNVGEKATGEVIATYYFPINSDGGTIAINAGTVFTNSGMNYAASSNTSIKWDGDVTTAASDCENYKKDDNSWKTAGCKVSTKVAVTAAESGTKYNIGANSGGWSTSLAGISVSNSNAFSGGSDKTVTVVQQSDIDTAMTKISTENESANKQKLLDSLKDDEFAIDSSFKQEVASPVSTPAVGEEVADGKKAKLSVTTTDTIFVIDETKLKEFIAEKAKLQDGYKIYEMNDPFIENFTKTDSGYVGKLKTAYIAGSTITENDVVETAKGKGIGTAKRDLSDKFSGIKTITFDTSVPWVNSVPGDTNKITVNIDVKE